jgi:hypothetical protein
MQTGVLTSENLASVLRDISQRRRQGTLAINLLNRQIEILCVQGKVVEAVEVGISPVAEMVEILVKAGRLAEAPAKIPENYKALFQNMNSNPANIFDEALFRQVVKERVLNKLYSLDVKSGAHYGFQMQMIEYDRDFCPSISIGQLLLDMVALESDRERFLSVFGGNGQVMLTGLEGGTLSTEECTVLESIGAGASLAEIQHLAMLSSYHIQDAMLTLYDAKMIKVGAARKSAADDDNFDDMLSSFEQSIDQAFDVHQTPEEEDSELSLKDVINVRQNRDPSILPEDSDGSQSEDDGSGQDYSAASSRLANWQSRMRLLSIRLTQSPSVVHAFVLTFLTVALLVPLLMWGNVLGMFGQF